MAEVKNNGSGFIKVPRWAVSLLATIFVGLLSFAIVWGMFKSKVNENANKIIVLQKDVRDLKKMHTDIAVIRNDVSWIKKALADADKEQKRKNK